MICGDGDCDLPSAEGKTPRNERLLRWPESWRSLLHRLWVSGEVYEPLRNSLQSDARRGLKCRAPQPQNRGCWGPMELAIDRYKAILA